MSAIERIQAIKAGRFETVDARRTAILSARAEEAAKVDHSQNFEADGYRVEIVRAAAMPNGIAIKARAFYNDRQLGFGPDGSVEIETFKIINPPLLHKVNDGPINLGKRGIFIESPRDAIRTVLLETIRDKGKHGADIVKGKIGRTTYTLFASSDGYIYSESGTYSTARSGNNLGAFTGTLYVGQTNNFEVFESFLAFDTSSVAGTISSAVLSLRGDIVDNSATDFTVNARLKSWTSGGLTTADWVAGASLSAQTLLATFASSGYAASYNAFTSEAAFIANINQSGNTEFMICSSRTEGNNTPSGEEFLFFFSADESGTTIDPKLVVDATSTSIPVFMNHFRQQGFA